MDPVFKGKTTAQWLYLLSQGPMHERCAAALVLGQLKASEPTVESALMAALNDPEKAVEVAVQIAIGFISVPAANQERMLAALLGPDVADRRAALQSLDELGYSKLMGTASPGDPAVPKPASSPRAKRNASLGAGTHRLEPPAAEAPPPKETSPSQAMPDIAVVTVLPWWFLVAGFAFFLLIAWFARGVWWARWAMVGCAGAAVLWIAVGLILSNQGAISRQRFKARARPGVAGLLAAICGFALCILLPEGTVYIENESRFPVRLAIDGNTWLTIQAGESKKRPLTAGKYRLTVHPLDGGQILDEHEIQVTGCNRYVLNVLGAQTYFIGTVVYGGPAEAPPEVVFDKWFVLPDVDYLFRDVPKTLNVRSEKRNPRVVRRTFVTKGEPPKLMGDAE